MSGAPSRTGRPSLATSRTLDGSRRRHGAQDLAQRRGPSAPNGQMRARFSYHCRRSKGDPAKLPRSIDVASRRVAAAPRGREARLVRPEQPDEGANCSWTFRPYTREGGPQRKLVLRSSSNRLSSATARSVPTARASSSWSRRSRETYAKRSWPSRTFRACGDLSGDPNIATPSRRAKRG